MEISEVDYEVVFQANPSALMVLTPELVIVAVSRELARQSGRLPADLIGRKFPENLPEAFSEFDAETKRELVASLERVVATGERDIMAVQRFDLEAPDRPGVLQPRYWSIANTPVPGPDGKLMLIIHQVVEVTPFVQYLQRSQARDIDEVPVELQALEVELYVRARQLEETNQQLREAHAREQQMAETLGQAHAREQQIASALRKTVERQQRFISDASHDLRNPITGLQTRLEVALQDADEDSLQTIRTALDDVQRLNEIVADLLELARLDAAAPVPTQRIDLADLVTEELRRRPHAISIVPQLDSGVIVNGNRLRLARLLANLLTNAERHATSQINVIVKARPPRAILEVIDDGPGIPPDEREQIFKRFYRRADAQRHDPAGTGLGLPIGREIALAHGGSLQAADHPKGARFVLDLPLVPAA